MECGTLRVTLKTLLINRAQAETHVFPGKRLGMEDVVGYYYGSLDYENMAPLQYTTKTYGDSFTQVTREASRKLAN